MRNRYISPPPVGRRRLASLLTALVLAAAVAGPAHAQVGSHWPAAATCSGLGIIQTTPMYEKIGPYQTGSVPQLVAHMYYFQNIATGALYQTAWSPSYYLAPNAGFASTSAMSNWWVPRGRYQVYTQYAWNLLNGAGWSYAMDRTREYGSFEYLFSDTYCHAQPMTTVVEGNSNYCGDFWLCAHASSAIPSSGRRATRVRGKLGRRLPNRMPTRAPSDTPAPPPVAHG
jgi:hypothetical protein